MVLKDDRCWSVTERSEARGADTLANHVNLVFFFLDLPVFYSCL